MCLIPDNEVMEPPLDPIDETIGKILDNLAQTVKSQSCQTKDSNTQSEYEKRFEELKRIHSKRRNYKGHKFYPRIETSNCYHCRQLGHFYKACPQLRNPQNLQVVVPPTHSGFLKATHFLKTFNYQNATLSELVQLKTIVDSLICFRGSPVHR